jgi:tyrosyl-tRNA synthetase
MSYTEFSYMLLQAYDYLRLHERHGVTLQVGGSDQWGNITAGIELIRRTVGAEAHALTFPLITNASGTKFGKTEAGAVWLDPALTSPYRFYQFWINTDDRDVGQMLRFFTLLDRGEIERLDRATKDVPEARDAQRALAREVTARVHGDAALRAAEEVSLLLFGKADPRSLSKEALQQLEQEIPTFRVDSAPQDLFAVIDAVSTGKDALFKSKSEARRALQQGGLYLNGDRVDENTPTAQLLHGKYLLVRKGARTYGLIIVETGK